MGARNPEMLPQNLPDPDDFVTELLYFDTKTDHQIYPCKLCDKLFQYRCELEVHTRLHTGERPYICRLKNCGKSYVEKKHLNRHLKSHLAPQERPYGCTLCPKRFILPGDLKRHSVIHSGHKPYKCRTCNKSFANGNYLKIHERIHSGDKPYKCLQCNWRSNTKQVLQIHLESHKQGLHHECAHCFKMFRSKFGLKNHIRRMHRSGEGTRVRKCVCVFCDKYFYSNSELFTHLILHTREMPHCCELCGREFSNRTRMYEHTRRSHTLEKAHSCQICGLQFFTKGDMTRHTRTHTDPIYPCHKCNLWFRFREKLAHHKKRVHGS